MYWIHVHLNSLKDKFKIFSVYLLFYWENNIDGSKWLVIWFELKKKNEKQKDQAAVWCRKL